NHTDTDISICTNPNGCANCSSNPNSQSTQQSCQSGNTTCCQAACQSPNGGANSTTCDYYCLNNPTDPVCIANCSANLSLPYCALVCQTTPSTPGCAPLCAKNQAYCPQGSGNGPPTVTPVGPNGPAPYSPNGCEPPETFFYNFCGSQFSHFQVS